MAARRRVAATIGAIAMLAALAGCAEATAPGAPVPSAGSATPSPTPEQTSFTTRNGTASFLLPEGWSVVDESRLEPRSDRGGPGWQNAVVLRDADDVERARYADGYGDDVGASVDEAAAVACLEAPMTDQTLSVLATLVAHPVPWDAMPDDVDPQADMPWVPFISADGTVAFSHPASWSVREDAGSAAASVTLVTPDGLLALDVLGQQDVAGYPRLDECVSASPSLEPWSVIERAPARPLEGSAATSSAFEVATLDLDGSSIVAIVASDVLDAGCIDRSIPVEGGVVRASTPYHTDEPNLVTDRFEGRVLPVDSYEHRTIVAVLGTLRVSGIGGD